MFRVSGRRKKIRLAIILAGLALLALGLFNREYGITPSHWWLRVGSATVSINGKEAPGISVYRSLRGDVLLFLPWPKYGISLPYFVDVHRQEVVVPNGDEAIALPGIALSRHETPCGIPMPQDRPAERQETNGLVSTADLRQNTREARARLAGIIEVYSHLIIEPDHIEFTTDMRQRIRIT